MLEGLKPYPEYKESGQDWLGQVPSHWDLFPNRALFGEVKDKNHPEDAMLSVTITKGVIPQARLLADTSKKDSSNLDKSKYKRVKVGDIAYNKMRAWQGAIAASDHQGIISPAYVVMRPSGNISSSFSHYLFRTPLFAKEAERWSYGITSDMWSLRPEHFKMIYSAVPPPEDQAAIVRFLDHANRKIDRFIRGKKKLIALLNEQKQVLIHQAVTKGLDPTVPMKDSGIPWLGEIPKHWEVRRCGQLFREVVDVGHPEDRLLSIDRFKGIIPQEETGRKTRASNDRNSYKRVKKGQLSYNVMNAFMGAIGFSNHDGIVSPAYAVAQPLQTIETRYYNSLFRTSLYTSEFNRLSYGIMYERNRLYFDKFKLVRCLFPPLCEQKLIADWLESRTEKISTPITRTEREIALMQEFRTRLTSDVVTGKLDVRDAAFRVSEELENNFPKIGNEMKEVEEDELDLEDQQ